MSNGTLSVGTLTVVINGAEDEATGTLGISGTVEEGASISANTSGLSDVDGGIANTTYQWQIDTGSGFADIGGATSATLNIPSDQSYVGAQVRLTAITTDAFGGTTSHTSAAQTVANVEDEATGTLGISGTVEEGASISADTSGLSDVDGGIANTTYQWQIDTGSGFADIGGATNATLNIPGDQSYVGAQVRADGDHHRRLWRHHQPHQCGADGGRMSRTRRPGRWRSAARLRKAPASAPTPAA